MTVNVDGAPNAYGPPEKATEALDFELNAHVGAKADGEIVGYLTEDDDGRRPVVQGPDDPRPGFFISTTSYFDVRNPRETDPRRYVNAAEVNYVVRGTAARKGGVELGDFCAVHSLRTRLTVFALVGDGGNRRGSEGSLALLQRLGYPVKNGKSGGADDPEIVVRYFARSNPGQAFFFTQAELDAMAFSLGLDHDFSDFHAGDPGKLVLAAVGITGSEPRVERVLPFAPLGRAEVPPPYPGHFIRRDSGDLASVRLIQGRLRALGFTEPKPGGKPGPLSVDGEFGDDTFNAVALFQTRHTDLDGDPLEVDGEVGSNTWGALFGRATVAASLAVAENEVLARVLEVAAGEVGVLEDPPGSNRGERVEQYQRGVGVDPGEPWCVAFVFFCFATAAQALGVDNPMVTKRTKTGSVVELWNLARANGVNTITHDEALDDPSRVQPGMVFIISTGGGHGHTGLVTRVAGGKLETIEGNTNDGGSREGIGVFRRTGRTVNGINRGFINFG